MGFGAALGGGAAMTLIENLSNRSGSGAGARTAENEDQFYWDQVRANLEPQRRRDLNMADITSRVDAAKAAGLHPLAAMGVSPASSQIISTPTSSYRSDIGRNVSAAISGRMADANIKEAEANARRANAEADITEMQAQSARANLGAQPGNPPLVDIRPNAVTASLPDSPANVGGNAPTQGVFMVTDAWTGQPRPVLMPSKDFGTGIENLGELWQAVLGAPYAMSVLGQKYLQTPREWLPGAVTRSLDKLRRPVPYKQAPQRPYVPRF